MPFTLLQFDSDDRAHAAYDKSFFIKGQKLYWDILGLSHCFICSNPDHQSNKCPQWKSKQPNNFSSLYNKYKPTQYHSNPNYSRPRRLISHYDNPKNKYPNQLPPSHNYSTNSSHKSYADFLKNGTNKGGSIYDNTAIQSSKIPSTSKKTSHPSGFTNNTSSSDSPDQSNNNATLNQILSCLTDIKQDIKSLKYDIHNLEQEQSKLIHKVDNIESELESFGSPSYELDDKVKDYFETDSQSKPYKSNNYDKLSTNVTTNNTSSNQITITLQDLVHQNNHLKERLE